MASAKTVAFCLTSAQNCFYKNLMQRIWHPVSFLPTTDDHRLHGIRSLSTPSKEGRDRPLIQLFTKDDCSLCEIAKENLQQFKVECDINEIDISKEENSEWFEKYKYDIPVIHLNGKFLMKHKVFVNIIENALKQLK